MNTPPPFVPGAPRKTDAGAIASMVLGIVGIVFAVPFALICGPIAIAMALKAKRRIAESGGAVEGAGIAQAGYILGIIATVLAALGLIFVGICLALIATAGQGY